MHRQQGTSVPLQPIDEFLYLATALRNFLKSRNAALCDFLSLMHLNSLGFARRHNLGTVHWVLCKTLFIFSQNLWQLNWVKFDNMFQIVLNLKILKEFSDSNLLLLI